MYGELYQYFILHKQLNIPGIGTFQLERTPADIDFANRVVLPPAYTVALHQRAMTPAKSVFTWLSSVLDISERDAVVRFNDFAFDMRKQILSGIKLKWEGLGTLSKGLGEEIRFEPTLKNKAAGLAIPAVKVLRENAQHTVRVGEEERTSGEMLELLYPASRRRSYAWLIAIILAVFAFLLIVLYFAANHWSVSSSGNQQHTAVRQPPVTYKLIR